MLPRAAMGLTLILHSSTTSKNQPRIKEPRAVQSGASILLISDVIRENYSDERVLCSAPQTCLANCMYKRQNLRKILSIGALRT